MSGMRFYSLPHSEVQVLSKLGLEPTDMKPPAAASCFSTQLLGTLCGHRKNFLQGTKSGQDLRGCGFLDVLARPARLKPWLLRLSALPAGPWERYSNQTTPLKSSFKAT